MYVFKVWNTFEMKTMKDYHDLYLKCDVLLLTNVFKKFENVSPKNYRLCQSHYLSFVLSERYKKWSFLHF